MIPVPFRLGSGMNRSIGARIVTLSLALLLVVQMASYGAIRASLARNALDGVQAKLQLGERVLETLLAQKSQKLIEGARLLSNDFGFRSALLSDDVETIASVLDNHGARIGATETAMLGIDFTPRASSGTDGIELAAAGARLAAAAAASGSASEIASIRGRPHQLVLVPMKAPMLVGWVLMGFPIEPTLAQDMRSLSALDLTLLTRPTADGAWLPVISSLEPAKAGALAAAIGSARPSAPLRPMSVDGDTVAAGSRWLTAPSAAGADTRPAVVALVSLSLDEALQLPGDLQWSLLLVTIVAFLAFVVGNLLTARQVTTPLRALAAAAERLREGDYATPIGSSGRGDEIGQLAHGFEQMRISIAEKQRQVLQLAYWDTLTDLPNRAQLRDKVREAIADAERKGAGSGGIVILMLDLDRFKHVNDVLGYRFGDLLLRNVAERLSQQTVRGGDLVARLGGDEFAVLLRDADAGLAQSVAERIGAALSEPISLEGHTVDMGAGVGMACYPEHGADADLLLSRAEVAMYAAKRRAVGPLMYSAAIDATSAQTLSLLSELRHAVERGELRLYLQPKLNLASGRVSGAETLVRWLHPSRGLVPPMQFIPFAEQTGFIRTLTIWIFEEAARHWLLLQSEGIATLLSVNLSTRDLMDVDLPEKFDALLVKHRVPAEAFCLEITESAIMDDPMRALATLNKLSALGFKLSIDDFGTGYSSLAYLKRLPVDEMKIDKSFVMGMEKDLDDAQIVRSTIDLAHNLGLTVVAEGVENAKVWELLRDLDCDDAQGYHMGRPMPATDFNAWSLAWAARNRPHVADAASMILH